MGEVVGKGQWKPLFVPLSDNGLHPGPILSICSLSGFNRSHFSYKVIVESIPILYPREEVFLFPDNADSCTPAFSRSNVVPLLVTPVPACLLPKQLPSSFHTVVFSLSPHLCVRTSPATPLWCILAMYLSNCPRCWAQ